MSCKIFKDDLCTFFYLKNQLLRIIKEDNDEDNDEDSFQPYWFWLKQSDRVFLKRDILKSKLLTVMVNKSDI